MYTDDCSHLQCRIFGVFAINTEDVTGENICQTVPTIGPRYLV